MPRETTKYLYDIARAIDLIVSFTAGKTFESYTQDAMLRAAVEREFEIVGEALSQIARLDNSLAVRVSDFRRIIAFRNMLVHAYTQIDDRIVWDIVESNLAKLRREVDLLLDG